MRLTLVCLIAIFAVACFDPDAKPPVVNPSPVSSPTPDPLESEITKTKGDITESVKKAAQLNAWAALVIAERESPFQPDTICEDVPAFGYKGLAPDSLWPTEYKELDSAVSSLCGTWRQNEPWTDSTKILAMAMVVRDTIDPVYGPIANNEPFDIENRLRERAEARESH